MNIYRAMQTKKSTHDDAVSASPSIERIEKPKMETLPLSLSSLMIMIVVGYVALNADPDSFIIVSTQRNSALSCWNSNSDTHPAIPYQTSIAILWSQETNKLPNTAWSRRLDRVHPPNPAVGSAPSLSSTTGEWWMIFRLWFLLYFEGEGQAGSFRKATSPFSSHNSHLFLTCIENLDESCRSTCGRINDLWCWR